jgi:two-component system, chemotaxis family, response regulator PixG
MSNPSSIATNGLLPNKSLELLERFAHANVNGCLLVTTPEVEWRLYFHQGQLTYATHSIEPFERLERYLRGLSSQNPKLTGAVREQARSLFSKNLQKSTNTPETADYRAILWLIHQKYLNSQETQLLVTNLVREVLQSYLLIDHLNHNFIAYSPIPLAHLACSTLLSECQNKLQGWQKLSNHITSSYQRPYWIEQGKAIEVLPPQQREKLKKILIGFNFRQLALLINQDALNLAQNLYPLIAKGVIVLKDPQSPFDYLPRFSQTVNQPKKFLELRIKQEYSSSLTTVKTNIVCVDDSPAMLQAIKQFLKNQNVDTYTISDPLKALREIVRLEPKLILLDVGMPNLDGYRLCRLIRNHSLFRETPIIMVTGNTGMIDRAKAKVAGATDYLTKPFSQNELENMVTKYLPKC